MNDAGLAAVWVLILGVGIAGCVLLHRWGVATTYVRDLLHVGTGIWVLGWRAWKEPAWPMAIVLAACAVTALGPSLASRSALAGRVVTSFAAGDERWNGLLLYTCSFAFMTAAALRGEAFSPAAALLALCLGDGLGGAVGRRFGKHFFRAPGGKRKSLEGSAVVALGAMVGVLIAAAWFGAKPGIALASGLGLAAAVTEALAPRGTDNVALPLVVWLLASAGRHAA
jgi:dolichol kinase